MNQSNTRESNFELLRVLLTIMIIILHYCNPSMGGALRNISVGTTNYYIVHFIESACIVAVNVFVLMTGYFMINKDEIKTSKALKLFYLSFFYGIIIFLTCIMLDIIDFNLTTVKRCIHTITDRWFVVIYCILYLLIPYINKFINSINQKQFNVLLVTLIIFFYIWPTFWTDITIKDMGYGIVNFIVLYLIGAYIKLYYSEFKCLHQSIIIYLICTFITMFFSLSTYKAFNYNSLFNLISAIALFLSFKSLRIKNNTLINVLASYTFSTYIIHENSFIAASLYQKLFKSGVYCQGNYFIPNLIVSCLVIYIICIIVEFVRRKLMEKYIDSKIEKIAYKIKI